MIKDLIYDVGISNEDDTAYYLHRGFKVIAIEAEPSLASTASVRFKNEIAQGQLQILNIGIASESKELDFWICETNSEWNSFDRIIASRFNSPHHCIKIICQIFRWVLEKYGIPYYLKVDIEGNDYLCGEALTSDDLPKYISVEVDDKGELFKKLNKVGYMEFKCIRHDNYLPLELPPAKEAVNYARWHRLLMSQNWVARIVCKILGRERLWKSILQSRRVDNWTFPYGSSGPFGEDTLGRWLNYAEMTNTFHSYQHLITEHKPHADFHARIEG
jgi:hypothetical protein